jgi:hypothetical protein
MDSGRSSTVARTTTATGTEKKKVMEIEADALGDDLYYASMQSAGACDYSLQRIAGRLNARSAIALPEGVLVEMRKLSAHLGQPPDFCRDAVVARGSFCQFVREHGKRFDAVAAQLVHAAEEAMADEWHLVRDRVPDRCSPACAGARAAARAAAPPCLKRSRTTGARRLRIQVPVMCRAFPHLLWMMNKTEREAPEEPETRAAGAAGAAGARICSPRTIIDRLHSALSCPLRFSSLLQRAPTFVFEMVEYYAHLFVADRRPVVGAVLLRAVFLAMHMYCRSTAPYPLNAQSWSTTVLSNTADCRALWLLLDAVRADPAVSASRSARGMDIIRCFLSKSRGKFHIYKVFERTTGIIVGEAPPAACSEERLNVWICDMVTTMDTKMKDLRARRADDCAAIADIVCGCGEGVLAEAFALARSGAGADGAGGAGGAAGGDGFDDGASKRSHFSRDD